MKVNRLRQIIVAAKAFFGSVVFVSFCYALYALAWAIDSESLNFWSASAIGLLLVLPATIAIGAYTVIVFSLIDQWIMASCGEQSSAAQDRKLKLAHRDDIDIDDLEKIEAKLGAIFPGAKLRFAGDMPPDELPPEVSEFVNRFEQRMANSRANGVCDCCGRAVENFQPGVMPSLETWLPTADWFVFRDYPGQELVGFRCKHCEAKCESDEAQLDCGS